MALTFKTTTEVLEFLEGFDGVGLCITDTELLVEELQGYDLEDDYVKSEDSYRFST